MDLNTLVTYIIYLLIYCVLHSPNLLRLIRLSAFPSSFFKQSSHIRIGTKIENNHSIRTEIKLGLPVSESSTKISKYHAPTGSKHKFNKGIIENWSPIEFKLGFPGLRIRSHNHQLLKLCKCSQIPLPPPRVASASNRTKTNHHWLSHLQTLHKH